MTVIYEAIAENITVGMLKISQDVPAGSRYNGRKRKKDLSAGIDFGSWKRFAEVLESAI
ncbi:MAG: hypothetical protein JW804_09420 [Sedimentisphaerales bacterium]|nr:hypothetical protein [Sedimentisphaerales bacterium]